MMKHLPLLFVVTALCCSVGLTGCKGGGGGQTAFLAAPGTGANLPASGTGNGTTPGTGAVGNGTGTAALTWDAPDTNTDGTALTDLAGYKVYYGLSSGNYTGVLNVGAVTSYTLSGLEPGTYYFAVTAYNQSGTESDRSDEVSKTVAL